MSCAGKSLDPPLMGHEGDLIFVLGKLGSGRTTAALLLAQQWLDEGGVVLSNIKLYQDGKEYAPPDYITILSILDLMKRFRGLIGTQAKAMVVVDDALMDRRTFRDILKLVAIHRRLGVTMVLVGRLNDLEDCSTGTGHIIITNRRLEPRGIALQFDPMSVPAFGRGFDIDKLIAALTDAMSKDLVNILSMELERQEMTTNTALTFTRDDGRVFNRRYPNQVLPENCPECGHPMSAHAEDSRIVGCQYNDNHIICGCRVMKRDFRDLDNKV